MTDELMKSEKKRAIKIDSKTDSKSSRDVGTMEQHARRHNGYVSRAVLYLVALASIVAQAHDLDTSRLPNHHIRLPATHVQVIINSYATYLHRLWAISSKRTRLLTIQSYSYTQS